MQHNEDNLAFDLRRSRNGGQQADRETLTDTRERTIAELKSQVIHLRRELARRDDVLMFLAGMVHTRSGEDSAPPDVSSRAVPERPKTPPPRETREGARRRARGEPEKREWPPLPDGYRVVAYASDAWVLVATGSRVAGYRGILDPEAVAEDAWDHHRRNA